jgi:hypothetical protein
MKITKTNFQKVNPYDLNSIAKHTQINNKSSISTLRSLDINSAGGKNSSFIAKNQGSVSKKK